MEPCRKKKLVRVLKILLVVALLAAVGIAYLAWYNLFREEPQHFATQEEEFKYGSIGTEANEGIPYWIWYVLPRVFPHHLPGPGGYASLGLVWEEGQEIPVGFSKRVIGFPRIGINCALCHAGSYRTTAGEWPRIVPGAPATRIDILGYQRFLFACVSDPRFNADVLMEAIEYNVKLSAFDKKFYRHILIPETKRKLLEVKERFAWTDLRPPWGRGRIDPFNPVKFHQLKMDSTMDRSIGNSDMEPIWALEKRNNTPLHWDGLNTSRTEVVLSGAIGDGATPHTLPVEQMKKLENWLMNLQPPAYPYAIDWDVALKEGRPIYQKLCADCHGPDSKKAGAIVPLQEIKTDHHRLEMWSKNGESEAARIYNRSYSQYSWGFKHFVNTHGYVAVPLNGIWLRAPYLHNGSVPTLEDLLEPKKDRPKEFYRGFDVYDRTRIGFIHRGEDILKLDPLLLQSHNRKELLSRLYFRYDTRIDGNDNGGHEGKEYGTELAPKEKRALIEYLKSL